MPFVSHNHHKMSPIHVPERRLSNENWNLAEVTPHGAYSKRAQITYPNPVRVSHLSYSWSLNTRHDVGHMFSQDEQCQSIAWHLLNNTPPPELSPFRNAVTRWATTPRLRLFCSKRRARLSLCPLGDSPCPLDIGKVSRSCVICNWSDIFTNL